MRITSRSFTATFLTVYSLLCLCPLEAFAQFQFGRVANQPWSGGVTVVNNIKTPITDVSARETAADGIRLNRTGISKRDQAAASAPAQSNKHWSKAAMLRSTKTASVALGPIMALKWEQARAQIMTDAVQFLNEHDVGGGWRTSKCNLNLAANGSLFTGYDGSGFTIRFVLPGNSLSTWLRTPTGVTEDADPGFRVSFDLEVSISVDLRGNHLVAGPAQLKANVQRPVGTNATGSAAVAAANILKDFLGGPDFIGQMLGKINGRSFSFDTGINPELAKLNPVLDKAAGTGGTIQPGYDAGSKSITLTLATAGPMPVVR
jgi:hypothetical protein